MSKCHGVDRHIAEIEQAVREGRDWCPCVQNDDLPAAKRYRDAGDCRRARYHAIEALKRCTGTRYDISGGEAEGHGDGAGAGLGSISFAPIAPLDPMSFILGGK